MSNENQILDLTPAEEDFGTRLDIYLSANIEDWTRSQLQKLIADGDALVNERQSKSSYRLREDDRLRVELKPGDSAVFEPEDIPLDVVFEDDYLAVINKPAGMVVHPGAGISSGTLANAVAFRFYKDSAAEMKNETRVGIVHRLDKDTSGLIVVAKNLLTHEKLSAQFRDRRIKKNYITLVHGFVRKMTGKIDEPIARDRVSRVKMAVDKNGRNALTVYKIKKRFEKFTLLDIDLRTGRTHQIRVHLAHLNHPIVADQTYNAGRDNIVIDVKIRTAIKRLERFFLHAANLEFDHPVSKERLKFEQPLPEELEGFLRNLES